MDISYYKIFASENNQYIQSYEKEFEQISENEELFEKFLEKDFLKKFNSFILITNQRQKMFLAFFISMFNKLNSQNIDFFWDFIDKHFEDFMYIFVNFESKIGFYKNFFEILENNNQTDNFLNLISKNFNNFESHLSDTEFLYRFFLESLTVINNLADKFNIFTKEQIQKMFYCFFNYSRYSYEDSDAKEPYIVLDYFFKKIDEDKMFYILKELFTYIYKYKYSKEFWKLIENSEEFNEINTYIKEYGQNQIWGGKSEWFSYPYLKKIRNVIIKISKSELEPCQKAFSDLIHNVKLYDRTFYDSLFVWMKFSKEELKEMLKLDYLDEEAKSIIKSKI